MSQAEDQQEITPGQPKLVDDVTSPDPIPAGRHIEVTATETLGSTEET